MDVPRHIVIMRLQALTERYYQRARQSQATDDINAADIIDLCAEAYITEEPIPADEN